MKRRTFLKIAGIGTVSIAAGCNTRPDKYLFSLVAAPDDMVVGKATWYAATCRECPAGCGILAKNREGRVIKVEGHPHHPINRGKLCMRGQAAVQAILHPDRLKNPLLKENGAFKAISFEEAALILKGKTDEAAKKGPGNVRMLTEVVGETLHGLFAECMSSWNSPPPVVFEPFAYESLKKANRAVFGLDGLPSYKMEKADFLVSFGADFLETWLSPVEYARKFKDMHAYKEDGNKGAFVHVSPFRSMTGANADLWISCKPGKEAVVALGLIREVLASGRGTETPANLRDILGKASEQYTPEKVAWMAGVSAESYKKLCQSLLKSNSPLIIGSGSGSWGENAYATDLAANLLNVVLDPEASLVDFDRRHRVETADSRKQVHDMFGQMKEADGAVLLLHNVNPAYALSPESGANETIASENVFTISFSHFMDETAELADLVFPVAHPLETWDEYSGTSDIVATLQPAMGAFSAIPDIGDVFLAAKHDSTSVSYQDCLFQKLKEKGVVETELDWLYTIQRGGIFDENRTKEPYVFSPEKTMADSLETGLALKETQEPETDDAVLLVTPSIRFFDGRNGNRPWMCEVPDPITKVAWHTPVLANPETLSKKGAAQGSLLKLKTNAGTLEAPAYATDGVHPGAVVIWTGQGHEGFGRYAKGMGVNPFRLLPAKTNPETDGPVFFSPVSISSAGKTVPVAHTDGDIDQHERKIALSVSLEDLTRAAGGKEEAAHKKKEGLGMWDFPMTLPLPEGYDPKRDFYPPHEHDGYRWAMVVDLDRCIGCGACATACYAENNVGIVGLERILEQREMSWLAIHRYLDMNKKENFIFFPMLCQHCDNAPCESVCPVYAPHHNKEGINNQVYNRCIGTRFCSQNCPYKVRRFNWFAWNWPDPLNWQLNPDVTVRSKGVMEKCSFCIQRIKQAHGTAKDEDREILDGEVVPACLQTCPTGVFTFGNLMDKNSKVRKMVDDTRAYQAMGYLNTKPAVIYLKKVVREI